jgi:hypothetical protein
VVEAVPPSTLRFVRRDRLAIVGCSGTFGGTTGARLDRAATARSSATLTALAARIVGVQIGSSWTNVLERSRLNAVVYGELQPKLQPSPAVGALVAAESENL